MRRLTTAILCCLFSATVAQAAQFEFALLSFPDGGIRWIDKSGQRTDSAAASRAGDLFNDLSGQDRKLLGSPQYKVLVLNGLSQSGWELASASSEGADQIYLMKRSLSATAASAANADKAVEAKATQGDATQFPLIFTSGHETDPRDHGRPVVLVAAALKVPDEVFRETFTHVKPAGPGQQPEDPQVRANKQALMKGLSPYGVTNDRLDEVSNFYRYSASRGQMWRNAPAAGYATVRNGKVTSVTVTNPGYGYSSEPKVSIEGMDGVELKATLSFGTDFKTNGSIRQITVIPASGK
jgi:hypothetical protein